MSDNLSFTQSLREEGFIITNIDKKAGSPAKSGSNGSSVSGSTNMIVAAIIVIALVLIMVFIR